MDKQQGLGKDRIGAFSDGVFAIAATLLVLDIHLEPGLSGHALTAAFWALRPRLLAYGLSFVIIGVYWVAHHLMLSAMQRIDRPLLWLNNLFLLFVAFIPASAGFLGSYPGQQPLVVWYGINLLLASGALEMLWRYATFHGRLTSPHPNATLVRLGHTRTLLALGIYGTAVAAA